ncbi:hypothetical protein [Hymenobacter norwichensis]|uniref:hypothetical protein n=1 Tax=Hymenobacter norwichensis TaxID=223903 RepID=UPI0003B75DEB|nr:hypothetical protein [Hymenobacter norwichensis]
MSTTHPSALPTWAQRDYQQLATALAALAPTEVAAVYALSFWKDNLDDDPRKPLLTVGYNTAAQWHSSFSKAETEQAVSYPLSADAAEAKWNFAFWLQNELLSSGGEDGEFTQWATTLPGYYTDDQYEDAEEDEPALDHLLAQAESIQEAFMAVVIDLARRLHADGTIQTVFGRAIPIIVHELEYSTQNVQWTTQANPPGLPAEFIAWVDSLSSQ